ncbi:MAG: von Willebrand factor type A domain-containing protein [Chloroflexi bacterium]|nr:von Willebrand factor type A domain-containing protein [Chloroflexota bacterium]
MNRKVIWSIALFALVVPLLMTACGKEDKKDVKNTTAPTMAAVEMQEGEAASEPVDSLLAPPAAAMGTTASDAPASGLEVLATPSSAPDIEPTPEQPDPADMFFQEYGVNPLIDTEDDHFSTFAMDVDTAAYTLARSYLSDVGQLPPPEAIRPEEMINYFDVDYPGPEGETPAFAIHLMAAPAPFGYPDHYLLRVGLQGRYIKPEDRTPALLIFVIDVSGSMDMDNRLGLVKQALALLVDELRPDDRVGIVVYTTNSRVVLEPTSARDADTIMSAINALVPEGSTNVADGLRLGYDMAMEYKRDGEITRLIVCSDGVANVDVTGPDEILALVKDQVEQGITLSTIGFGMGNYNDVLMEQLANDGNGNYYYVDTLREAKRVFVYNLTGTLQVIAYDAKVQVDFNPEVADRYRLIGYENRDIADTDFRNDTVDAGEVGAGHSITALYELALENPDVEGVIATVYIRYQDAETREVVEYSQEITVADLLPSINDASPDFRLHAAVAELSELLRNSYWAREGSYGALLDFANPLADEFPDNEEVAEFVELIHLAGRYVDR